VYPKIAQLKDVSALRRRLVELGLDLPVDDSVLSTAEGSPLSLPLHLAGVAIGNRWCIHPMEGWDAHADGSPSEHTLRRWRHFGLSGAKLIWGGEAAAVREDGRANPNQTLAVASNRAGLTALLAELLAAHRQRFGRTDDLLVGLQLTHSGRFSRPNSKRLEPKIAYHHPILDGTFAVDPADDSVVVSDDEVERLIDCYVAAAGLARDIGFRFVDVKACHGYLLHEFLSAFVRPGPYGGDFEGRTRLLRSIVERIRAAFPDLIVGVRLSAFDTVPYEAVKTADDEGGRPAAHAHLLPYRYGFGVDPRDPTRIDLTETLRLLKVLSELGVPMVNVSCGSPYYNPHVQRPAIFPPSDGYQPPEDPLVGVARQIHAARACKAAVPELVIVGTGYSYLQDYTPHVAQATVRAGWTDVVGLGRMVLSYPELPADCLSGVRLDRKRICRTFSDCTTAPRNGLASGCYPLDAYYKALPESRQLREIKEGKRGQVP
jgi:2,4-dienoyl-CoA reductase-like NADH-dependent reductase (Old Yellow Enzyme family)